MVKILYLKTRIIKFKPNVIILYFSEMEALQKLFKSKFKQQALDGDSKYAKMNLEDSNPNNLPPPLKICALTIAQVKDFRVCKIISSVFS